MSIEMKLNRQALVDLIEKEPELRFELTSAVVSEVIRRFFVKDSNKIIAEIQPDLFLRALEAYQNDVDTARMVGDALNEKLATYTKLSWRTKTMNMSPEMTKLVNEAVRRSVTAIADQVHRMSEAFVREKAEEMFQERLPNLDARIAARLETITVQHMDKEITRHHDEVLAKLKGALS